MGWLSFVFVLLVKRSCVKVGKDAPTSALMRAVQRALDDPAGVSAETVPEVTMADLTDAHTGQKCGCLLGFLGALLDRKQRRFGQG